ncbi:hypothetical protein LA324_05260 [Corynebacterium coyleae]|uniref:hypothetical protein n=1 Tax=Corynebacterium coyleae TaxID=53374 RepID=UPI001CCF09B6|nr:hypothetical protein [Corynebacterium coyleae]UBI10019.1 hypothetical protein LA324_05260 [Corynebacterium coyleae]
MKIRLVNHKTETEEAYWGTCELCEFTGPFDYTTLTFQADDGSDPYEVDAFHYEPWYGPVGFTIKNMYDFAYWIDKHKVFKPGYKITTEDLEDLLYEYEEWSEGAVDWNC